MPGDQVAVRGVARSCCSKIWHKPPFSALRRCQALALVHAWTVMAKNRRMRWRERLSFAGAKNRARIARPILVSIRGVASVKFRTGAADDSMTTTYNCRTGNHQSQYWQRLARVWTNLATCHTFKSRIHSPTRLQREAASRDNNKIQH